MKQLKEMLGDLESCFAQNYELLKQTHTFLAELATLEDSEPNKDAQRFLEKHLISIQGNLEVTHNGLFNFIQLFEKNTEILKVKHKAFCEIIKGESEAK